MRTAAPAKRPWARLRMADIGRKYRPVTSLRKPVPRGWHSVRGTVRRPPGDRGGGRVPTSVSSAGRPSLPEAPTPRPRRLAAFGGLLASLFLAPPALPQGTSASPAREYLYVANTLGGDISIVEI